MVDDEGEIVHYAFYADTEPINVVEALKNSKWMHVMKEALKSIEDNKNWSLVKFPEGKKAIYMKWVYNL